AWQYTLDALSHYFERALMQQRNGGQITLPSAPLLHLFEESPPKLAQEVIGPYLEIARLLGQRTAELHLALASAKDDPDFAPEPFSPFYRRSIYQSMRSLSGRSLQLLRTRLRELPVATQAEAEAVLSRESEIVRRFRAVFDGEISGMRIRCHGDYHLGQALHTGKDFIIIDFEGEPARPLSERRLKRSPIRDVAGMLRSFHYAACSALFEETARGVLNPEAAAALEPWACLWHVWVSAAFLKAYLAKAKEDTFLPQEPDELQVLLDALLLEKAVYELGYELNNRPQWVRIPLQGILRLLETSQ
ncbi:MAG: alpha-amylase, partial [Chloroflexota bacterium]